MTLEGTIHEPRIGTPEHQQWMEARSREAEAAAELSTEGMVGVHPRYAKQHPEAVINIGGKFYRHSIPSELGMELQREGISPDEQHAARLRLGDTDPLDYLTEHPEDTKTLIAAGVPKSYARGLMASSIKTKNYKGEEVRLTPVQVWQYQRATGKSQFKIAQDLGLIAPDAVYIGETEEGQATYQTAEQVKMQVKMQQSLKKLEPYLIPDTEDKYDIASIAESIRRGKLDKDTVYSVFGKEATDEAIAFDTNHVKLPDGTYMANSELENLYRHDMEYGTSYFSLATGKGFDVLSKQIEADEKAYNEFQNMLTSGEIIALPDGQYIARDELDRLSQGTQQILLADGFKGIEALGEGTWTYKGKAISDAEREQIIKKYEAKRNKLLREGGHIITAELGPHPTEEMRPTLKTVVRRGTQTLSFMAPPAKALLPEFTIKDVSGVEWGLGAVNVALIASAFAPGALLASTAGKATVTGLATTGAGLVGFETGQHWSKLTPAEKSLGVAATVVYALPILSTVARGIKVTTAKPIPTLKGEIPTWRGLAVAQNPIIGRSGGKWVIGARDITLPEAKLILNGYKPEVMLETKVFVNPTALQKAGFSKTQIDYLTLTLKDRNLFAGKKSPFLDKEELLKPTQYLDADEIQVLMRQINKYREGIKQVDLIYGSATIKTQLAPELRQWRNIHDWDISTTMGLDKTATFTKELLSELNKIAGKRQYRISPKHPTLIEKKIGNDWKHIADIHSHEMTTAMSAKEIPTSKLDVTGDYSYGRMVAEPAITIEYPGVGKFDIMRLSESGVRKSDTILRIRQTPEGTAFKPPERGIASPGIPKDAADFYVILKTYELGGALPRGTAEEWVKAWARVMGYTTEELPKVLPNLVKALEKVASETPTDLIGYRFYPSKAKVSPSAVPTVSIHIPSSLAASVARSPSLAQVISKPINVYSVASKVPSSALPSLPTLHKYSLTVSKPVSARVSPLPSTVPSVVPSPSAKPSQYLVPKSDVSPSPSPAPAPSPSPSPPVPSPPPKPEAETPAPPPILVTREGEKRYKIPAGSIAWRQGMFWKYIPPPWQQAKPITLLYPPAGAVKTNRKTPEETIQMVGKPKAKVPESVSIDLGVVDIIITKSGKAIEFKGHGEKTSVGQTLPHTTKGMSIPAIIKRNGTKAKSKHKRRTSYRRGKPLAVAVGQ